jgi:hypothetical protein
MNCSELKEGQVLVCKGCGFELKVTKECRDDTCTTDVCSTGEMMCCGEPMKLKQ